MNPVIQRSTRLGELLIELGYLTREQLDAILERQAMQPPSEREPIGQLAVSMGFIGSERFEMVLDQWGMRLRLGELLQNRGRVSAQQIDRALATQQQRGGRLGEILLEMGAIDEETLAETLGEQYDLPFVPLSGLEAKPDLVHYVNALYAARHQVTPIGRLGRHLTVAIADPTRKEIARDLERSTGLKVRLVLATPSEIADFSRQIYEFQGGAARSRPIPPASATSARFAASGDAPPDASALTTLITRSVAAGARDVHIEPDAYGGKVRIRVDGVLRELEGIGSIEGRIPALIRTLKSLARLDSGERRRPQEGSFAIQTHEGDFSRPVSLHVTILPGPHGESAHARILDRKQASITLEEAGLSHGIAERFAATLRQGRGVFLIAGPPGSGRRSTLRATLSVLRAPEARIFTAEDPIVFVQDGVSQAKVDPRVGNTYAALLRSFLKQDPDAILLDVLESRDACEFAFGAGSQGPRIVGTIRANNATDAVAKLVDIGVDRSLIANSLAGVLAQRLVRSNCPACTGTYEPARMVLEQWFRGSPPSATALRGNGCEACSGTGFQGRVAVAELWSPTDEEMFWIRGDLESGVLRERVLERIRCQGQDALEQAMEGRTTLEEALKVVPHGDVIHARMHGLEREKEAQATARLHRAA
jgi:type II secretory ATPase GspE/PulE/Tfp pilus assembly ATPase PilB-like protein